MSAVARLLKIPDGLCGIRLHAGEPGRVHRADDVAGFRVAFAAHVDGGGIAGCVDLCTGDRHPADDCRRDEWNEDAREHGDSITALSPCVNDKWGSTPYPGSVARGAPPPRSAPPQRA